MRREDLLTKLVTTLHLNVPERKLLGVNSVPAEEVAAIVKRVLEANGVFPPNAKPWQPGEPVFEGFFLLKQPNGGFVLNWQRAHPTNPYALSEQGSSNYDDLDQAISRFMGSEWRRGIDGIKLTF